MEHMTDFQKKLMDKKRSPIKKYMEIFVGEKGFFYFLKFELITTLFGGLGGSLGLFLRKIFYPLLFKKVGENCFFGKNITLRQPHKIVLGDNCIIDDFCVLDGKSHHDTSIVIGNNVFINRNTVLSSHFEKIEVGDNTDIGPNCLIQAGGPIKIGRNVITSAYCYFVASTRKIERINVPVIAQGTYSKGIEIGDNCYLGAFVMVNDGVKIGRDSVIGAGSIVLKDIPEFTVAYGIPAKPVRSRLEGEN
ncbi:MAG: DapH/DapD/GlmU-related protein [Candidatus Aminicenantia bacterium]